MATVEDVMKIEEPRKLIISIGGFIAMLAFFVWAVATGPRPGN